jgi:hypothetical protein
MDGNVGPYSALAIASIIVLLGLGMLIGHHDTETWKYVIKDVLTPTMGAVIAIKPVSAISKYVARKR